MQAWGWGEISLGNRENSAYRLMGVQFSAKSELGQKEFSAGLMCVEMGMNDSLRGVVEIPRPG